MGVYLDIQGVERDRIFTPYETVKGVARLELNRSTVISNVTVCLEGLIRTSLIEKGPAFILGNDVPKVADESHQLFKTTKVLFPRPNSPFIARGYTLSEGQYTFHFEMKFPISAKCSISQPQLRHRDTPLPPSFRAQAMESGARANVEYLLCVQVTRRTRLRRVISTAQSLNFIPFDPAPVLLSALRTGCHTHQKGLYITSQSLLGCSMAALPILLLEAKLPSPPLLYPRERLLLRLCVRTLPMRIQHVLPIKLQSLALGLRHTTKITADVHRASWTSSQKLLDLHELDETIKCDRESDVLSEIKPDIIQRILIPEAPPSFTACTVEHQHSLVVDAVFSLPGRVPFSSVKLIINVEILSGNNADARTQHVNAGEQTSLQVPLRDGCLVHLGALDTVETDAEPPGY
ncbi:hypothetical protein BJX64DRAFT_286278 [Aspergillus heterothallicus]